MQYRPGGVAEPLTAVAFALLAVGAPALRSQIANRIDLLFWPLTYEGHDLAGGCVSGTLATANPVGGTGSRWQYIRDTAVGFKAGFVA
jgi:hypothetical protein